MLMRMGPLVQLQDSFLMADVWATESAYDTMVNFSVRDSTGNLLLLWFYFIQLPLMAGHKCSAVHGIGVLGADAGTANAK